MGLFDKLKSIADTAKDVGACVKGLATSAIKDLSGAANSTSTPAPIVELELLDETTLEYTFCDEFELQEIAERPGEYEIVEYIGFDSVPANVEIPSMIDGQAVTRLAEGFFKDNKEIRYVKLSEGIREIAHDTFCNSGVRGVILPETLEKVGARAFQSSDLMRIALPDSITFIGRKCFQKCNHLQFVKLPKSITILPDFLFDDCRKLRTPETVVLPDEVEKVGRWAAVPCAEIPITLRWLSFGGLHRNREKVEEYRIPECLTAIDEDSLQNFPCRRLIVPAGLSILNAAETGYALDDEDELFVDDNEEIATETSSYINFKGSDYEEIVLESGSTYILFKAFEECKNLVKLYIPESVEDIEELFGIDEKRVLAYTKKGEAIKDEYGRQVYDWDGTAMKTKDEHHYYTEHTSKKPINPELTIYCHAGSAAYKYAKENGIKYAKWDI